MRGFAGSVLAVVLLACGGVVRADNLNDPVTDLRAYRVEPGRLVLYYELTGSEPRTVRVLVGAEPAALREPRGMTGDLGPGIAPGLRRIDWDIAADGFSPGEPLTIHVTALDTPSPGIPAPAAPAAAEPAPEESPAFLAVRTDLPVLLDGLLDDPTWLAAPPCTAFVQREPSAGATPGHATEVRFLYDDDALYIGVLCHDDSPGEIVRHAQERDGAIQKDDHIVIALDPFNNRRTAFYFGVNPNGAMLDGEVQPIAMHQMTEEWDGVWHTAAKVISEGWSAEIEIPFKTMRFPAALSQSWGCNVRRVVANPYEEMLLAGWGYNDGIPQVSRYGRLEGIEGVRGGRRIEIKPYLLAGLEREAGADNDERRYGLDARFGITSNLTLDLTANTDFAQVEVDREQINLTRFSLLYPEKRDFFLEGQQIFDFGAGSNDMFMFYSRRIGLTEDRRPLDILGGGKFSGVIGRQELGALVIRTDAGYGTPEATYGVVRLKRNLFKKSFIGGLATHRSDASGHGNQGFGLDTVLKTDSFLGDGNLEFNAWLAGTVTPDASTPRDWAGKVFVNYLSDQMEIYDEYTTIGAGLNPEVGFVPRKGVRTTRQVVKFTPRVPFGFIRKLIIKPVWVHYTTDEHDRLLTRDYRITVLGFETRENDTAQFQFQENYDLLDADFPIFANTVIPAGRYQWWNRWVQVQTSASRAVSVEAQTSWGAFYDGRRTQIAGTVAWKPLRFAGLALDGNYNDIGFPGRGSFIARTFGGTLSLNPTTWLALSTYVQYTNETDEVLMNVRLHIIPRIGSDCYIVYNESRDELDDFRSVRNAAMLKVDYLVRL